MSKELLALLARNRPPGGTVVELLSSDWVVVGLIWGDPTRYVLQCL